METPNNIEKRESEKSLGSTPCSLSSLSDADFENHPIVQKTLADYKKGELEDETKNLRYFEANLDKLEQPMINAIVCVVNKALNRV